MTRLKNLKDEWRECNRKRKKNGLKPHTYREWLDAVYGMRECDV